MGVADAQAFYDPSVGETINYVSTQDAKDAIAQIYTDMGSDEWPTYVPSVTQGVAVTVDWSPMQYARIGKLVHVTGLFRCSTSGTAATAVDFTLPVNAGPTIAGTRVIGTGYVNNGGLPVLLMLQSASADTVRIRLMTGSDYTTQITNGWVMSVSLTYQAAEAV